jgi:hypothetical protein
VTGITARARDLRQIEGKSFPPTATLFCFQGITVFDSLVIISARLALLSVFVMLLALAGINA